MNKIKKAVRTFSFIAAGFSALSMMAPTEAQAADGGLFVEPAITYELGDTTVNYPSPLSNSTGRADGLGIGARLGFHIGEAFFVGADGRYSMPGFKDSSVSYDAKSVSTLLGPVVGFQMPDVGLRVWGTYLMWGELNPEASGNFDVKFTKPSGFRVGAGFRVQSFSINAEYQQVKYAESVLEQFGPFTPGSTFDSVNLENKSWIISASFPIEL